LKDIRASITEKTVDIFSGYRKNFSGSHPPGQLVLPENLKEFSMYMLGLLKSRAFKGRWFLVRMIFKAELTRCVVQEVARLQTDVYMTCECSALLDAWSCLCICIHESFPSTT
jgi:hypothetical protein